MPNLKHHSVTTQTNRQPTAIHLDHEELQTIRPPKGTFRYLGGNLGFACPISIDVVSDEGELFAMGLGELLLHLDSFTGKHNTRDNILAGCFSAYEYMMTPDERSMFEEFVRAQIGDIGHIDAARKLVLGKH